MQPLLPHPLTETSSKHARGRPFAVGKPGRKVGSKNRTTVLAAALLAGEAQPLVRKAVEIALAGNVPMLRFLLDRLLPRDRLIKLDLPRLEFADDAVTALGQVFAALAAGEITVSEASAAAT
jgi:hypothetical protein